MKDGRGGVEGCSNVGSCCIAPTSPGVSRLPRKKVASGAEELIWQPPPRSARLPSLTQNDASFTGCLMLSPTASFSEENHFSSHKWWNRKLGPTPATGKVAQNWFGFKRNIEPSKSSNAMEHVGSSPIDKLILSKKTKSIDIDWKRLFTDLPTWWGEWDFA